jgi:membrane-bound lytic murein transglycosylase D
MRKLIRCLTLTSIFVFFTVTHSYAALFSWVKPSCLWVEMRQHFDLLDTLPSTYPDALADQLRSFHRNQHHVNQLIKNATPYIYYVYQETKKLNMPAEVALIPMIESAYNPFAYSHRGAVGLWQMMPGTASGFRVTINWWYDGRRDVVASTRAALNYLSYLYGYFGDWLLAIAAYDSGEGTIEKAIQYNQRHHKPIDFWSLPLPTETKVYIPKLLALAAIISNPKYYEMNIPSIPNRPYFSVIDMDYQMDINKIATLADEKIDFIRQLNPGFKRWATLPNQAYALVIPQEKETTFRIKLNEMEHEKAITWIHHSVQKGETLSSIANRYHTQVKIIQTINKLKTTTIYLNQSLLIPKSLQSLSKTSQMNIHTLNEKKLPGPQQKIHYVASGETLASISNRYGLKSHEIIYWNQLKSKILHPKQRLVLWLTPKKPTIIQHRYRVKKGDTLGGIAKKFHSRLAIIKTANRLKTNTIYTGQLLIVPETITSTSQKGTKVITYIVKKGDTLSKIANHYRIPIKKILAQNHIEISHILKPNEKLRIIK